MVLNRKPQHNLDSNCDGTMRVEDIYFIKEKTMYADELTYDNNSPTTNGRINDNTKIE